MIPICRITPQSVSHLAGVGTPPVWVTSWGVLAGFEAWEVLGTVSLLGGGVGVADLDARGVLGDSDPSSSSSLSSAFVALRDDRLGCFLTAVVIACLGACFWYVLGNESKVQFGALRK